MIGQLSYYWGQVRQAQTKRQKPPRKQHIDAIIAVTALPIDTRILCLGPRNGQELDAWQDRGYWNLMGLDLLPTFDRRIRLGDMHHLPYWNETVGLVYASHVLEHSLDAGTVAKEIIRVLVPGGYLFAAFPIHFKISAHDRVDFKSAHGFLETFAPGRFTRLWSRETPTEAAVLARLSVP